eukprot:g22595.t1
MKDRFRIYRDVIAFWILGLLNNFLYVTMNAGAENINEAGIALVYLANILPRHASNKSTNEARTLLVKLTGPYWFHYVSYRCRMNFIAILMVFCLCIVAWGDSTSIKLLGVAICSLASGVGEASLLAMASFYETKPCLAAWSSGTGFAGIAGYAWSLAFDAMNTCFQVQLMVALWIPIAWYFTFFYLLGPPWIDKERGAEELACGESEEEVVSSSESVSSNASSEHSASEVITGQLSAKELMGEGWRRMESTKRIQAGFWAAMGFPVTNRSSRHAWYKWANFTYQIGVFISRSSFVLICKSRKILWLGGILQVIMVGFFGAAATTPFGDWWLIAPALFVGFLGGGVYVGAFTLISQERSTAFVELALSSASVADTFGIITANILGLIVQGCVFGQMKVLDTRPDFTYRAMGRLGDRGANCGSRLAAKFWSMKMRLLLFASFMAWRFRLARESSAQLRKALAETEAAHFAFASRGLMLSDAFRRWRRWAADLSFQRSVSALLSRTTGPGRVLAVVSSIEEKRRRLLCMEAFLRWTTVLRWKSSSPKAAQTAQAAAVFDRSAAFLNPAPLGLLRIWHFAGPSSCCKARLLTSASELPKPDAAWWPDLARGHLVAQLRSSEAFLALDRAWALLHLRPEQANAATPEGPGRLFQLAMDRKPMTLAVKKGCRGVAELLRSQGAVLNPGAANALLHEAASTGNLKCLELLLLDSTGRVRSNCWASPNARPSKPLNCWHLGWPGEAGHGGTALDAAEAKGHEACAQLLRSIGGRHSIQRSAELALPDTLRQWLQEGADVEERDGSGATPLWLTAKGVKGTEQQRSECIQLLLGAQATVDALPITQETPLMVAAQRGSVAHCQLLLQVTLPVRVALPETLSGLLQLAEMDDPGVSSRDGDGDGQRGNAGADLTSLQLKDWARGSLVFRTAVGRGRDETAAEHLCRRPIAVGRAIALGLLAVIHPAWTVAAAAPPVTMRVSSAPQAVRAASCPSCGNVYLPDSIFCRRCGRKRDLVSLDGRAKSCTRDHRLRAQSPDARHPRGARWMVEATDLVALCRARAWAAALALFLQELPDVPRSELEDRDEGDPLFLLIRASARAAAWQAGLALVEDQRQLPQRTLNALLKAVAAQQQFQQALTLLPADPHASSWQALLGAAVSTSCWETLGGEHAIALLQCSARPSGRALSACGSALARARRWAEALWLMEAAQKPVPAAFLTAVLGALGKVRKWQLAQALLKERAASWGEDLGAYNAALQAVGWQRSAQLLREMQKQGLNGMQNHDMSASSISSDALSSGALLHALSKAFRWREALVFLDEKPPGAVRPLEMLEALAACHGAGSSVPAMALLRPWGRRLPLFRPHVTLTGRCQGEGEVAALEETLQSYGMLLRKAREVPLGALGLRGRLDELRRGRVPRVGRARGGFRAAADVEGNPMLRGSELSGPAAQAQSLATWCSFRLRLRRGRILTKWGWTKAASAVRCDDAERSEGGQSRGEPRPKRPRAGPKRTSVDTRGVSAGTGSVCKLFVRKAPCNFADPWRKHSQQSSTGTGFLLENRWVVTNAHVVHRAVSVLVRPTTGNPVKYNARVVAVGLPCDLAVLQVDEAFWKNKESLNLSRDIPKLDDNVTCIGFPVGGENISVTRGVVSRIDVNIDGLMRIQIDAAINPGNSGGPVLGAHGLVVGMASSILKNASNIGYIIPSQVLEQFISCIETADDGAVRSCYLGTSSLGIGRVQTLESPALRRRLKLPEASKDAGGEKVVVKKTFIEVVEDLTPKGLPPTYNSDSVIISRFGRQFSEKSVVDEAEDEPEEAEDEFSEEAEEPQEEEGPKRLLISSFLAEEDAARAPPQEIYRTRCPTRGDAKSLDLLVQYAAMANGGGVPASSAQPAQTTVMLRNLPNNYTRAMVCTMMDKESFKGHYDFLYLPIDARLSGDEALSANLGYAFVNLVSEAEVQSFWKVFDGYTRWVLPSAKVCSVSWSGPHQGQQAHVDRYKLLGPAHLSTPIMHSSVPDEFKPVIFAAGTGERLAFPAPSKKLRAPRRRPGQGHGRLATVDSAGVVVHDGAINTAYKRIVTLITFEGNISYTMTASPAFEFKTNAIAEIVIEVDNRLCAKEVLESIRDNPLKKIQALMQEKFPQKLDQSTFYAFRQNRHPSGGKQDFQYQCIMKISHDHRKILLQASGFDGLLLRDFLERNHSADDLTVLPKFWPCSQKGLHEINIAAQALSGNAGVSLTKRGLALRVWISHIKEARKHLLPNDIRLCEENMHIIPRCQVASSGWPPGAAPIDIVKATLKATSLAAIPLRTYRSAGVHVWILCFEKLPTDKQFYVAIDSIVHEILLTEYQPQQFAGGKAAGKGKDRGLKKPKEDKPSQAVPPPALHERARIDALESRFEQLGKQVTTIEQRQSSFENKFDTRFDEIGDVLRQLLNQSTSGTCRGLLVQSAAP